MRRRAPIAFLLAASCSASPPGGAGDESWGELSGTSGDQVDVSTDASTGDASPTSTSLTSASPTSTTGSAASDGPQTTGDGGTTDTSGAEQTTGSSGDSTSDGGVPLPPDCPRVKVTVMPGNTLNVRPTPSTAGEPVGALVPGAIADVLSLVHGEVIGDEDLWFEIAKDDISGFVLATYVECTTEEAPQLEPPAAYWLPLECGKQAKISQGNFGNYSHQGKAAYAFDFAIPLNTPMVAMADGIVLHTYAETMPGDACYDGGGEECFPYANLVILLHGDGSTTLYKHLNAVNVVDGEFVPRGDIVGLSGSTGYSTGPHAHTMRMENCGATNCQSVALAFADVAGDGVPDTGQTVTSMNCP
ncbi:peptidoglycan DD-metalloendopeptidase family protein [Nannocystis pusilla]|uniref:Peptidoglycan DD-metalloendopeptidase family protein n=1 Tax=Nannocystis pusilla TaxID=889268 RepID=A0ABS7TRX0_9BACT|nr:peptidoglycan DD-metalloendopeptidase family protein [Nannocystis pusilla]MBZ5710978.1 peptidoglycan DD-metalloendopeptidase family protein [Nannocystis pusilla]